MGVNSIYFEDFDDGPGGWYGWIDNKSGPSTLELVDGIVTSRSPWWVDYNHAAPGTGYLHLVMCLHTSTKEFGGHASTLSDVAGVNRFRLGDFLTDLRHARLTLRLRGDLALHGAGLRPHVQARVDNHWVNHVMIGQQFTVTPEWSQQSLVLAPEPHQWCCLGSRHDRSDFYGTAPIERVLRDVNRNLTLVLFPLDIVPAHGFTGDPHLLRAGEDYALDTSRLPQGYVQIDSVRIDWPARAR